MPQEYDAFAAAAIQSAVNDKLPPGFCLYLAYFKQEPGSDQVWFNGQFSYCDREKFLSIRSPANANDLDPTSPEFIQYVVDMIEAEPTKEE